MDTPFNSQNSLKSYTESLAHKYDFLTLIKATYFHNYLTQQKKMGSIRPKLGPYRWNQNFGKNVEYDLVKIANFDLVHETGSN